MVGQNQMDSEARRQAEIAAKVAEYHETGSRLYICFYIMIASVALGVLAGIAKAIGNNGFLTGVTVLGGVVSIFYGLAICAMPRARNRFALAGVCQIIVAVMSIVEEVGGSTLSTIAQVLSLVFGLIYIFNFIPEMIERLGPVDVYTADSWNNFLKLYIICLVAPIAVVILALIGLVTATLLVLVYLAVAIAAIVMLVWQMILLKRSADSFSRYEYREYKKPEKVAHNRAPGAWKGKEKTIGADQWLCLCGNVNPNFIGTCACGVKKSAARNVIEKRKKAEAAKASAASKPAESSSDSEA